MKHQLLFKIFVFLFITLFCCLGTWQLYRLQWKQDLIFQISNGLKNSPIPYSSNLKKNYQKVNLTGKYFFQKQIYLYSLNNNGEPGYDVITPFKTIKEENVLINRGWIKKENRNKLPMISAKTDIAGMLRTANRKNFFTPKNDIKKISGFILIWRKLNNLLVQNLINT